MSKRRTQFGSAAQTEAARRELMKPVTYWERTVGPPKDAPASTMRVPKWVVTDKVQQFSDDEGEEDQPLVPLPEEPDAADGDEDMDAEESGPAEPSDMLKDTAPSTALVTPAESVPQSGVPTPAEPDVPLEPSLMDVSLQPPIDADMGDLDVLQVPTSGPDGVELDLSALGPDGTLPGDLSQLQPEDSLLGGPLIDQSEDPFSKPPDIDITNPPDTLPLPE